MIGDLRTMSRLARNANQILKRMEGATILNVQAVAHISAGCVWKCSLMMMEVEEFMRICGGNTEE